MRVTLMSIREADFEPRVAVIYNGIVDALFLRHSDAVDYIDGCMGSVRGYRLDRAKFYVAEIES